jgi:hypothetical protein
MSQYILLSLIFISHFTIHKVHKCNTFACYITRFLCSSHIASTIQTGSPWDYDVIILAYLFALSHDLTQVTWYTPGDGHASFYSIQTYGNPKSKLLRNFLTYAGILLLLLLFFLSILHKKKFYVFLGKS